jgi:beta-N-acetylhexosaminidase
MKHPGQAFLVRVLHEAGVRLVVVSISAPYDLLAFPHVGTYVATYGSNPPALDALAGVLSGRAPAQGRLPIEL